MGAGLHGDCTDGLSDLRYFLMRKLYLGVVDIPYQPTEGRDKGLPSTGDVAEWLEKKYGVMESFVNVNEDEIAERLAQSMSAALQDLLIGAPPGGDPLREGFSNIEEDFKRYVESRQVEGQGLPGVPTQAALDGVNHRLKHPYAKGNPRRSSFVDTGQYLAAFKVWSD